MTMTQSDITRNLNERGYCDSLDEVQKSSKPWVGFITSQRILRRVATDLLILHSQHHSLDVFGVEIYQLILTNYADHANPELKRNRKVSR